MSDTPYVTTETHRAIVAALEAEVARLRQRLCDCPHDYGQPPRQHNDWCPASPRYLPLVTAHERVRELEAEVARLTELLADTQASLREHMAGWKERDERIAADTALLREVEWGGCPDCAKCPACLRWNRRCLFCGQCDACGHDANCALAARLKEEA